MTAQGTHWPPSGQRAPRGEAASLGSLPGTSLGAHLTLRKSGHTRSRPTYKHRQPRGQEGCLPHPRPSQQARLPRAWLAALYQQHLGHLGRRGVGAARSSRPGARRHSDKRDQRPRGSSCSLLERPRGLPAQPRTEEPRHRPVTTATARAPPAPRGSSPLGRAGGARPGRTRGGRQGAGPSPGSGTHRRPPAPQTGGTASGTTTSCPPPARTTPS